MPANGETEALAVATNNSKDETQIAPSLGSDSSEKQRILSEVVTKLRCFWQWDCRRWRFLRHGCCISMLSPVQLFATSRTVVCQAPLSKDSPGKNDGVGRHVLLLGNFPTQGLNPHLQCPLHWQADSLLLSTWEALRYGWISEHLPLTEVLGQTIPQKTGQSPDP